MNEPLYLVCVECGGTFDSLDIAAQHEDHYAVPNEFRIEPESVAM